MQVNLSDITNYIRYNQQPEHIQFAGKITGELIVALNDPIAKKEATFNALDQLFSHIDWSNSFIKPLLILHFEFLHNETLVYIHEWLRQKCADIENIGIVSSESHLKKWWEEWCSTMHQKSFFIIELLYIYTDTCIKMTFDQNSLIDNPTIVDEKLNHLNYYYSYYAGTEHYNERSYIGLRVSELIDYCLFDSMYQLPSKQSIVDYVEEISYYKDQQAVDLISAIYDKNVVDNKFKTTSIKHYSQQRYENFKFDHFIWSNDRCCFANIARETKQDCPFTVITEKTLRPFWYHNMCIPLCYQSVSTIETYGFRFPHDIFDYSYQYEKDFHTRITKLIKSLTLFVKDNTIKDLKDYYVNHLGDFMHNAKIVKDMATFSEKLHIGI